MPERIFSERLGRPRKRRAIVQRVFFARRKKAVQSEGILANVRVDEKRDFRVNVSQCRIGGQRDGYQIADATNIENDLIGPFFQQASAEESNHRLPVLLCGLLVSMK